MKSSLNPPSTALPPSTTSTRLLVTRLFHAKLVPCVFGTRLASSATSPTAAQLADDQASVQATATAVAWHDRQGKAGGEEEAGVRC